MTGTREKGMEDEGKGDSCSLAAAEEVLPPAAASAMSDERERRLETYKESL